MYRAYRYICLSFDTYQISYDLVESNYTDEETASNSAAKPEPYIPIIILKIDDL